MCKKKLVVLALFLLFTSVSLKTVDAAESTSTDSSETISSDASTETTTIDDSADSTESSSTSTEESTTSTSEIKDNETTSESTSESTTASSDSIPLQQNRTQVIAGPAVFDASQLYSYPLGVGSEFTAFAGGAITLGYQNATGYMGANALNSVNSWPTLFTPNLSSGGLKVADPQENITLVTNSINSNLETILSNGSMFPGQKIIVPQANIPAAKKSQHTAADLQSFKDNGILADDWQGTTTANLAMISAQYQKLTQDQGVAVSDASIKASQQVAYDGHSSKNIHTLTVDLSQYTGSSAPIIVFDLQNVANNDAYNLNYTKSASGVVPYFIFNWQDSGTFTWGWNNSYTVSGDATTAMLGTHMIHSFPNASKVIIHAFSFYGSILAPQGSISVSGSGSDAMHSSYVASGDIDLVSPLPLNQAAANQFDFNNWAGKQVPVPENIPTPTIALTRDDAPVSTLAIVPGQDVHLAIQTTNYQGVDVEESIDGGAFTTIPIATGIDLKTLAVGEHTITLRIPDYPEVTTTVMVTVSGYLTLDTVPDLQFGSKNLEDYVADPSFPLVDGQTSATTDTTDPLTVKVTDNRYPQTPWSLSVQLSAFSDGQTTLDGRIAFSSDAGSDGILNGEVSSQQSLVFRKNGSSDLTGSLDEKLSKATLLKLTEKAPEPGTYQGKLTWSLTNAPQ